MSRFDETKLPPEVKLWFARAIAGMITADGTVTDDEVAFLREAINFLEGVDDINQIVNLVKSRKIPGLQSINIDMTLAREILFYISDIAVTDGNLSQREIDFFRYIGSKLGIDQAYCQKIITWAKDYDQLKRRKQEIMLQP